MCYCVHYTTGRTRRYLSCLFVRELASGTFEVARWTIHPEEAQRWPSQAVAARVADFVNGFEPIGASVIPEVLIDDGNQRHV